MNEPGGSGSASTFDAVAEARYATHYAPTRTPGFVGAMGALCAGLVALCFVPEVRRFLGVAPSAMAGLMVAMLTATGAAALAAKRSGVLGRAHRRAERIETLVCAVVGGSLLLLAGRAASVFWLVPIVNVVLAAPDVLGARWQRGVHALSLGGAALAYALRGQHGDALIIAFGLGVLLLVSHTQEQSSRASFALEVERDRLRVEVEKLQVESERQRIARDLHDGVGAELAALAWAAEALVWENAVPSSEDDLKALSERARLGLRELRTVVQGLKASALSLEAFAESVRQSCGRIVPPGCVLTVGSEGSVTLPRAVTAELGLMVREAVRNAAQHGQACRVDVRLGYDTHQLTVTISDDGAGLPPDLEYRSDGGLSHLQTRAELLRATIAFERPAQGTRVIIRVPGTALEETLPP